MTLKEIAEKAGVSISTASRVLNKHDTSSASDEIREKLHEIAAEGNYTPGRTSKTYRMKRPTSDVIACLYARDNPKFSDNPYFNVVSQSFMNTALDCNYSTQNFMNVVDNGYFEFDKLISENVNAAFVLGRHSKELIDNLSKNVRHIVYSGLNPPIGDTYDCVTSDAYKMGITATEYLISKGHKKIAYIGDTGNESRFEGFKSAIEKANLTTDSDWIINIETSMKNGYSAMSQLLEIENGPTAVFCMNDCIAVGALRAMNDAGKKISVIGIDDIEASSYTVPKLTTIHAPMKEMGELAAKLLIDRIQGKHSIVVNISLPFSIIERESVLSLDKV